MDNFAGFSQFRKQSKKGILVIFLSQLVQVFKATWVLLFLLMQRFSKFSETTLFYTYLLLGLGFLILILVSLLIYKNFQFKIDNNHFILKKGILKKTLISIPFDRIQNINFKQNIVQQIINTYEVSIETAGSSKAEIAIKAMSLAQANLLKTALTNFKKTSNNVETEIENKPFLKINFLQLLKESLTENHLQSLFLTVAFAIGIFQQVSDIFKNFKNEDVIDNFVSEKASVVQESILLILIIFVFFVMIALISSFVRVLLIHFDQTVFIKNETVEIAQGLTTKKSVVLKKNKIQFITISTNPLKKFLNSSFISFAQATSGKMVDKKNKIIKIIGCQNTHISVLKNLLFPNENIGNFDKNFSDSYYKKRLFLRTFIFLGLLNIAFYLGFQTTTIFWSNGILVPLFIALILLKFKKRYYLFSDDLVQIGTGLFETHTVFLPFFKVQNIKLKQTFFQDKKNVADLVFQTASGKLKIPCISLHLAEKLYNYTLFKIETNQQSWM
jgi:putative membrane protein